MLCSTHTLPPAKKPQTNQKPQTKPNEITKMPPVYENGLDSKVVNKVCLAVLQCRLCLKLGWS